MKTLFEFTVDEKLPPSSTGETVVKTHTYAIIRPSSSLKEDAEVFHAKTLSDLVGKGVLTRQMLQKRLINDGGTLSDIEKENTRKLYEQFLEDQEAFQKILVINAKDRTPEQVKQLEDLTVSITIKNVLIQDFERSQMALFDNTAEVIARNRHVFWWILFLAYEKVDNKYIPIFTGNTYADKRESYDNLSEDDFFNIVFSQFVEYISAWYIGRIKTREDFEQIRKESLPQIQPQNVDKVDEKAN